MMHIHWRLAELWLLEQQRELTKQEIAELNSCMKLNAKYAQRLAEQYNYGQLASMTKDSGWLKEVSEEMDKLERLYELGRPSFLQPEQ